MLKVLSNIFLAAVWLMALVVLLGFVGRESTSQECNGLQIDSKQACRFVEIPSLYEELGSMLFDYDSSATVNEVDLKSLEQSVLTNPYIARAEAFTTITGCIRLDIEERVAYMRFTNQLGEQFLVDENGIKMPVKVGAVPHLPIASGFISEPARPAGFKLGSQEAWDILNLQKKIDRDELMSALVTQVYYNSEGEIELVNRVANHSILIGTLDQLEEKFNRVKSFYKSNIRNARINKYKTVDVRFKKQVVCR